MSLSPAAHFERVLLTLDGIHHDPSGIRSRKVFSVVTTPSGADVRIDPAGLFVLYPHRRKWFSYLPELGPPLVSALLSLRRPGETSLTFTAAPATMRSLGLVTVTEPRKFWIVRDSSEVRVASRAPTVSGEFDDHPTPLAPWAPEPKLYAQFAQPHRCPHCAASAARMRLADAALICPTCGCSHRPHADELARAVVEALPGER